MPFDVDVMRGDRRELGARREQRGEMKHAVHLELREHPIEQVRVGDRTGELAAHERRQRRVERVHVERDDAGIAVGEAANERVANLAARTGDEDNCFAHDDRGGIRRRGAALGAERIAGFALRAVSRPLLHHLRQGLQFAPRVRVLTEQRRQIERHVFGGVLLGDRGDRRPDFAGIGLRVVVLNQPVLVRDARARRGTRPSSRRCSAR